MSEEMHAETPATGAAGGNARAKKLTAANRSAIAKKAATARWGQVEQEAVCGAADKPLRIGDIDVECYVLKDGTRVLTERSLLRAIGRTGRSRATYTEGGLPPFLQGKALEPFLPAGIVDRGRPIPFKMPMATGGARAYGYNAELLPDICETFLAAYEAGKLPPNQHHIAARASILVRGLARVGIIALVDEATGYQDLRTRNALEKILAEFIDTELQLYLKTFPDDFYREMFRLRGVPYSTESASRRPQYFGSLTNDIVYKRLAPGVLEELKKAQQKTATGSAKHKLFQRLTQSVGYPKLREHLGSVVTLMKMSDDWDHFKDYLDRMHPLPNATDMLPIERGPKARKKA